ncbi:FeS cluster assembly protein SufD [Candidatus Pantoea edessiphila]|uniref:FeS cluster assembly protein SufD n=1 Tax=Candidatus Pantoea edessiphila TaxID=2044610 RepID=A0A2P5T0Q5_9GAMM|nr:Fe-S cluster assembly protein SufD [Candidatus Pantoea edessiphila]PPI88140.1 FeS cluster assembly protein SufD [Candidatus Pantoea edessiphila]
MAGLPKSNGVTLQQWYQLFKLNGICRSSQSKKHWDQLVKTGFPDSKNENWKYTPLNVLLSQQFISPKRKELTINTINQLSIIKNAFRLVFINGYFASSLSFYDNKLFEVKNITASENINLPEPIQPEIFLHLTESLKEEITVIRLSSNTEILIPIYLLHITDGYKSGLNTVNYRHHFILENNTKAEVIEHFVTLNSTAHFTGSRLTFKIDNNVNLKHTKLGFENNKSYHFSHNDMIIGFNSNIISNTFIIGTNMGRHNTSVKLNGEKSQVVINSLSLPKGQELIDIRTYLEHNNSHCISRQIHKNIVLENSRAVFNGHIKVSSNAIKTDGHMINKNLLLSDKAEVNTKPQLQIYADDVKCSHGVTIGCIDDEQIFYLRSRGIKENDAKAILINAFSMELIEILENDLIIKEILNHIDKRIFKGDM